MKQKVIFFDADGTIVDGDYMSSDTKQTLIQLAEKGHILVLSTGRAAHQFGQALKQMEFENVISSGGNVVTAEGERIFDAYLDSKQLIRITNYLDSLNVHYHMEGLDSMWIRAGSMDNYLNRQAEYQKSVGASEEEIAKRVEVVRARTKEAENMADLEINKIHYFHETLSVADIQAELGNDLRYTPLSLNRFFSGGEISRPGVDKRTGMIEILNYFGKDVSDTIAVGDDYNDIEMLEFANYSVVLGHAPEKVKAHADFVSKDIENDGFAHAMRELGLV